VDNKEQKGQDLTQVISGAVQGLIANANRLGLTWQIHLASAQSTNGSNVFVVIDGDSAQVVAQSMIGPVGPSERVYILAIPPGGLFVIGKASRNRIGCTVARVNGQALSSGVVANLSWDTVIYDPMKMFVRTSPTIITCQQAGLWAVSFSNVINRPPTGRALASIITGQRFWRASMVVDEQFVGIGVTLPLNAGDQIVCEQYAVMAGATTMVGLLHAYLVGA
jgi:hypothetical protein